MYKKKIKLRKKHIEIEKLIIKNEFLNTRKVKVIIMFI